MNLQAPRVYRKAGFFDLRRPFEKNSWICHGFIDGARICHGASLLDFLFLTGGLQEMRLAEEQVSNSTRVACQDPTDEVSYLNISMDSWGKEWLQHATADGCDG